MVKFGTVTRLLYRAVAVLVFCLILSGGLGAQQSALGKPNPVSLHPLYLPTISNFNLPNYTPCKLPEAANRGDVGLGFPRYSSRMPSTGTVHARVLFVDFSDAPAAITPAQALGIISPGAENFYKAVSYGRLNLLLEPYNAWLRMSKPSTGYPWAPVSYDGLRAYIQEAVNLADPFVDFSTAQAVYVITNPAVTAIGYGPAFTGAPQFGGVTADGVTLYNGAASGNDLTYWGSLWLNHEGSHTLGLVDLYAFTGDTHRFVGGFDLMGLISGLGPELFAYERWLLGWLDDP